MNTGPRIWRRFAKVITRAGCVLKFSECGVLHGSIGRWLRRHCDTVRIGGFSGDPTPRKALVVWMLRLTREDL